MWVSTRTRRSRLSTASSSEPSWCVPRHMNEIWTAGETYNIHVDCQVTPDVWKCNMCRSILVHTSIVWIYGPWAYPFSEVLPIVQEPPGALGEARVVFEVSVLQHESAEERHETYHGLDLDGLWAVVVPHVVIVEAILLVPQTCRHRYSHPRHTSITQF